MPTLTSGSPPKAEQVTIERLFEAPRELLFKAWTDEQHLSRWYAPAGCEITFRKLEIRPGGEFHSCIKTPNGHYCWCRGTYSEIKTPERIVYSMLIADEAGKLLSPDEAGMDPDWPRETIVTVTFEEIGPRTTKLTLHQSVNLELAKRTGAYPSWLSMFDRLEESLALPQA
jgi:uncharacterized protein YndB with AHSA1/START domain